MKIILSILCMLTISAYSQTTKEAYQLFSMKSLNNGVSSDSTIFNTADLSVSYSFWEDGGVLAVGVYNKTDKFIYWQLDESFLIKNGNTFDYYNPNTKTTTTSRGITSDMYWIFGFPDAFSRSSDYSITEKQQPVVIIPPKAWRVMYGFNMLNKTVGICSDTIKPIQTYTPTNTPLSISNIISYHVEGNTTKRVTHSFYVSNSQTYTQKEFIGLQPINDCDGSNKTQQATPFMDFNRFYVKYTIPIVDFCDFGKCNETKEKCSNCSTAGSAYCDLHLKDRTACRNGVCKFKGNGLKPCGNCANSNGLCGIH